MGSEQDPFLRALGRDADLPTAVWGFHHGAGRYCGRCSITRGRGGLVALALRAGGFPPAGEDLPVSITIRRTGDLWFWERDFAGHITRSRLGFDAGRGCVREQIGALTIWMRPVAKESGIAIGIHRLSLLGIPCPRRLLPRSASIESQDGQARFCFDISARLPGVGLLIRYSGWLVPDNEKPGVT